VVEPLGYGPFARLLRRSTIVLTDSGEVQEEAPSLVMRHAGPCVR
jgi:UDP-N-acetylglucosamine 2-epimerase (non-hydrolysing)